MPFTLVPLPFPTDALEPYIDARTMQIHHDGHHAAYVNNLNAAIQKAPQLEGKSLEDLLANNLAIVPESIKTAVRNNAGGDYNHRLFWEILNPANKPGPIPVGNLANAINTAFGSFDKFKEQFTQAAMGRFGSGWAWLVKRNNKLEVISTANQDSPLLDGAFPVAGLDVWEHAYYLKYQNRRAEYVTAWWNVVNWKAVDDRFTRGK
ncbi:MAG: superoxide dismutase [Bacillota bacterium]